MNTVNYTHKSGLLFTTERMMSCDETASHDISLVCIWLPNGADTPMIIVDWYCGEPNIEDTKRAADRWLDNNVTADGLINLIVLQDLPEDHN